MWKVKPSRSISVGSPALTNKRPDGYVIGKLKGKVLYAHRVIFLLAYGYCPKEVDHIDGNRSNNHQSNLRDAARSENMQNMVSKGFSWDAQCGKFRARLYLNNKEVFLGNFNTALDARATYLSAKKNLHPFATPRCFGSEI